MSLISSLLCPKSQTLRNVWRLSSQVNSVNVFKDNTLMPSMVMLDQKRNAVLNARTKKRRKTFPFRWWVPVTRRQDVPHKTYLNRENNKFVDVYIKNKYEATSPLKVEQLPREEMTDNSVRCGLIARKLGTYPMWTKTGRRLLTTALQVVDNHVIKYYTPEEWEEQKRPTFYRKPKQSIDGCGVCVVGAESADPRKFTAAYRGLFNEAGIMPKNKITKFYVTPNAKLTPGTPLLATHFRVGDYVSVWGKTIDHNFQGVIKRWNFKGQDKYRGVTKAHRRPGTIGRGRKVMGPWKGHKMAGHMGSERRVSRGLKIWRINTKHNVIWVQGPSVPGSNGSWVYIYDCLIEEK